MKPTDILRSEHETILDVLTALESIARRASVENSLDLASAQSALDFLRGFVDRCHHGKEEQHFFLALSARGLPREVGPLAVMAADHDEGRSLMVRMSEALADAQLSKRDAAIRFATAARAYVTLMRDHIAKENSVLFPMGDGMLTDADQAMLLGQFERFEHADMGPEAHARFLDIASGLCDSFDVKRTPRTVDPERSCCGHGTRCS